MPDLSAVSATVLIAAQALICAGLAGLAALAYARDETARATCYAVVSLLAAAFVTLTGTPIPPPSPTVASWALASLAAAEAAVLAGYHLHWRLRGTRQPTRLANQDTPEAAYRKRLAAHIDTVMRAESDRLAAAGTMPAIEQGIGVAHAINAVKAHIIAGVPAGPLGLAGRCPHGEQMLNHCDACEPPPR